MRDFLVCNIQNHKEKDEPMSFKMKWLQRSIIILAITAAYIIYHPSLQYKLGIRNAHRDIMTTFPNAVQVGENEFVFSEPEHMPDGLYRVTYITACIKDGKPSFDFGLYRDSTHDDWRGLHASDFIMKSNDRFGLNELVRIQNSGRELVTIKVNAPEMPDGDEAGPKKQSLAEMSGR